MNRVNVSDRVPGSKRAVKDQINRLRENWQRGAFDTLCVRSLTHDVLFELREQLHTKVKVRMARRWNTGKVREKLGFAVTVVNQTLWCLRQMLQIAVDKRVLIENTFATTGTIRDSVLLRRKRRIKDLPKRGEVEAMFEEIRRVPNEPDIGALNCEAAWHNGHVIGTLSRKCAVEEAPPLGK